MKIGTLRLCAALALGGIIAALAWHFMPHDADASWPLVIEGNGGEHHFRVELAITEAQQAQGLMHRRVLDDDAGMLFVYPRAGVRTMWMKDTPLSLDMLFIGADGIIRKIARNTAPYSETIIVSPRHTQYVLELRAGATRRLGIQAGDRVRNLPALDYVPESSS